MIPHTVPGVWPDGIPSARFASGVRRDEPRGCRVGLLGMPDDLGVRLNNGRPGAAGGPAAFRAALAKYGVAEPNNWEWPGVFDAGDVEPARPANGSRGAMEAALHETHRRVSEASRAIAALGLLPVGIGGGHDLTFPFVRGVIEHERSQGRVVETGVYLDAHLDVRETVGSGMPFRRLIEACGVKDLTCIGLNPMVNSREHWDWFNGHGGRVVEMDGPREFAAPGRPHFLSLDLDCLDSAHAPGVSALNACGMSPREVAGVVRRCASSGQVRCFDIMELNPGHDADERTARLAAHMLLEFLRGIATAGGGA